MYNIIKLQNFNGKEIIGKVFRRYIEIYIDVYKFD